MSCRGIYCEHKADCRDVNCEGHPIHDAPLYAPLSHRTDDAIGYEAALPIVTTEPKPIRKPRDWTAIGIWCAVIAACLFALAAA